MPQATKPERMLIVDIDRSSEEDDSAIDEIEVQFNPTNFTRAIEAAYEEFSILGQSFQPHEWLHTKNQKIDIDLVYVARTREELEKLELAERFIESFMYPPQTDNYLINAPSRMLLIWPNTLSLRCRLHSVSFKHEQFNRFGSTVNLKIAMSLKEASVQRITKGLVQRLGAQRAQKGVGEGT